MLRTMANAFFLSLARREDRNAKAFSRLFALKARSRVSATLLNDRPRAKDVADYLQRVTGQLPGAGQCGGTGSVVAVTTGEAGPSLPPALAVTLYA